MSKTYSLATQNKNGDWFTNWGQHSSLDDIDWDKVDEMCRERGHLAYGYYYGEKSSKLTSAKNRTVLKEYKNE